RARVGRFVAHGSGGGGRRLAAGATAVSARDVAARRVRRRRRPSRVGQTRRARRRRGSDRRAAAPQLPGPGLMVTVDDVRAFASTLPRAYEVVVRGRTKFRVGRIVFLSFSKDGETMGCGFPTEWRDTVVRAEPEKFSMPGES